MNNRKKSLGLLAVFLLLSVLFYIQFDTNLDIRVTAGNFSGQDKGAGYQSMFLNITNNEEHSISPEFFLITSFQSGPIKTQTTQNHTIRPGETAKIKLETQKNSYIPIKYQKEFLLIVRDNKSLKNYEKSISIEAPVEKTFYQNPDLETYQGNPTGWNERFKGNVRKYRINKGLEGVEIRLPRENSNGYFNYYLTQDFNLTENVKLIVDYENLEDAEAGFRILRENTPVASENSIIEVELTEYTGQSSERMNETFNLREIYEKQNATYRKGETVQLQLFFESDQDTPNSIHWKEASIGNQ